MEMTQTAETTADRVGPGVSVKRHFTEPGVHPFEAIDWEIRDAVIGDPASPAFEQRGVEFPASWSQNATNIVAQKYFRGNLGTPERESSVKQIIGRVAGRIAEAGREGGYFASEEDAEAFEAELTHILVRQMAAFNSPVWFNVGWKPAGEEQSSACFILAVDDDMRSILQWNTEEGLIFRGGSGSGINLSKIRGSTERLSKGGTASGPVSFMRGADAWAGSIKSGGGTRRAAKMVVLDADHPDIRDFIWCKAKEEEKADALRRAGFDMSIDGDGFHSIQYQNANNSVRLTDAFLQAVEDDADWQLLARTNGAVTETVKARELMHEIAEAAWRCADPGVQYDTTINDWHTTANDGRITASNPCSEYVSNDNTACNLASLNLMRFRADDGSFLIREFEAAVDTLILAQEIIVSFSAYPTEKIAENTRRLRQLGIGYANLGALLMSNGMPYDSTEGRAVAGAVTALMTGRAYRRSAEVAEAMGPYEGYADNREPHNRVMAKHRSAAYAHLPSDEPVAAAAQQAWDDVVALGRRHGFRNAQASVLAPTGTISFLMDCDTTGIEPDFSLVKMKNLVGGGTMTIENQGVPKALENLGYASHEVDAILAYLMEPVDRGGFTGPRGSLVGAPFLREEHLPVFDVAVGERAISASGHIEMMGATQPFISGAISKCITGESLVASERGLVRIRSLHGGEEVDSFRPMELRVASLDGQRSTDAFYYGGERPTLRLVLRSGHQVTGTPNHRVLVTNGEGLDWRRLDELEPGDQVATQYGDEMWAPGPARFDGFDPSPLYGCQKSIRIPEAMSDDLAFFLGAFAAEGHITRSTWSVRIANADETVIERLVTLSKELFSITPHVARWGDKCPSVELASKTLVQFFDYLGCGGRAADKRFPDAVLASPREMVLAFLAGLSLDSYLPSSVAKWAICLASNDMLDDLQAVLTNLGIVHGRVRKYNADYDTWFEEVYVGGRQAQRLVGMLSFPERHKALRAAAMLDERPAQSAADVVPGLRGTDLYALLPKGRSGRSGAGTGVSQRWRHLVDPRTKSVSLESLKGVATVPGVEMPDWLDQVLSRNLHFSPIEVVEDTGSQEVYDISVPGPHAFVANGIVNHNTVNMPNSSTVEDIEGAYLRAHELGVKALAIYRDGSKTVQALVTDGGREDEESEEEEAAKAAVEPAPRRRRMPRERQSITHKFSIGGHEGYITAGMYGDGTVGEIFLTDIGKEGSTLRGMMNSFATAISIALQYGVPLETLVRKFCYMRFEPEGMTQNPEIPFAKSMPDYIMRWLASRFLSVDVQEDLGILTPEVRSRKTAQDALMRGDTASPAAYDGSSNGGSNGGASNGANEAGGGTNGGHVPAPMDAAQSRPATTVAAAEAFTDTPPVIPAQLQGLDLGPACGECGGMMQRTGSCYTCSSCGNNTGCG